jgi:putative hemolysin
LLSSILVGNTLVNVAASALGYTILEQLWPTYAVAVSVPAMTLLLLVLGEISPKRLALRRPEKLSVLYVVPLEWANTIMSPVTTVVEWLTRWLKHTLQPTGARLTEAEFRTAVGESEHTGLLDREERIMVEGIIRLESIQASDVMTPRVDVVGVDLEDGPEELRKTAQAAGFRYLPLYRGSLDHVEGFLDVCRFTLLDSKDVESAKIPALFVPETAYLDKLLNTLHRKGSPVACVADEFGGTAGLITRGDILAEIVADVPGRERQETPIEELGPSRWLISGIASLEEINYALGLDLRVEGADRLSGWISTFLGRVARPGDIVNVQGCRVRVRRVRKHRVVDAVLEKLDPGESA